MAYASLVPSLDQTCISSFATLADRSRGTKRFWQMLPNKHIAPQCRICTKHDVGAAVGRWHNRTRGPIGKLRSTNL